MQKEDETQEQTPDRAYQEYVELSAANLVPGEPRTYQQMLEYPDVAEWVEAMNEELSSLIGNGVWEVVPKPPNTNIVICKWVYKLKRSADGNIARYKARLVARGFTQAYGIDYTDTYVPVTRLKTIRLLFALAVEKDWEIRQIDVKTAYLNGDLDEEIFMAPPEGYNVPQGHVLLLKKSLYGLKQAGRQWYKCLKDTMSRFDLKPLANDPHTYVGHKIVNGEKRTIIIPVYVDDLYPIGDKALTDEFEKWIPDYFGVTLTGDATSCLGIRILRNRNADPPFLSIDQEVYANEIVRRANRDKAKPSSTPLSSQEKLEPNNEQATAGDIQLYQRIIGAFMYLMLGSRPDLAYAVQKLSRFSANPSSAHSKALERVMTYILGTTNYALKYCRRNHGNAIDPTGFTDADFASDTSDSRSVTGYTFLLGDAAFSWFSKKLGHTTGSTAETEYAALYRGGEQAFWLRQFYEQIGLPLTSPIKIYCDNEAANAIARNQGTHSKAKSIRVEYHTIRERIDRKEIEVEHVRTEKNLADIFTKSLQKDLFYSHVDTLGIVHVAEVKALLQPLEADNSMSSQFVDAEDDFGSYAD